MRTIVLAVVVASCRLGSAIAAAPPARPDASVPAADVDSGAADAAAVLRQMAASLADESKLEALEAEIVVVTGAATERYGVTGALLDGKPPLSALDDLMGSWQRLRARVDALGAAVRQRLQRCEANLATLAQLHDSWARALDLARGAGEPESVLDRAQATLTSIETMRRAIEQRRSRILLRLDAVVRATQSCDDALGRIADARRDAVGRIFSRTDPPLWHAGPARAGADDGAGPRVRRGIANAAAAIGSYAETYGGGLAVAGLLVVAFGLLFRRGSDRAEPGSAGSGHASVAPAVWRTPWAAAVLLGLGFSVPLRPYPPLALQHLFVSIATVAAVAVLRPLLDARLRRVVWLGALLFVLDLLRALLDLPPWPAQLLLVAWLAAVAALALRASAAVGRSQAALRPGLRQAGRTCLVAVGVGCAGSAVAAALGWVQLADFVGSGLFDLAFIAVAVVAYRLAAWGGLALALRRGPLARMGAVTRHRALVERRAQRALDATALAIFVTAALRRFELVDAVAAGLQSVLDARLQVGELDLALGRVIGFAAVVVAAVVVTRLTVFVLEEDVYSRMALPRGVPYALSTLTRYGLLLAGFLLALGTLGVDVTHVTVLLSAFGLGIGLGLQEVVHNFVSGLILVFERPVQVGDSIQLGDLTGEVRRIGIRSSTLRTSQGAEVVIPNSKLLEDKVTNWTLSDRRRRIDLGVRLAYDADAEAVMAVMRDVAAGDPRVHATPAPEALLLRFGEGDGGGTFAEFELRVWTDEPHWTRLRSDLGVALQRELRAQRPH